LETITGKTPLVVGYPYGAISPETLQAAASAGLKLGFTVQARKDYLRSIRDPQPWLTFGRFVLWGNPAIQAQCRKMRSDLMLHYRYEQALRSIKWWFRNR
jgi:hypothetical protein